MEKIKIGIVEDNRDLRETLQQMVEDAPGLRFVCAFSNAEDAIRSLPKHAPDVVLMDIHLPFRSGIECTRRIKDLCPGLQVLILTVYEDSESIFDALKAGASGYLLKRSTPEEVRQAIRDVRSGGAPMSAEIARRVVEAFHQPVKSPDAEVVKLSKRENEILEHLTTGLANKEIADRLTISVETVRVHLRRVYEKLHVHSRTEAAMKFRDSKSDPRSSL